MKLLLLVHREVVWHFESKERVSKIFLHITE